MRQNAAQQPLASLESVGTAIRNRVLRGVESVWDESGLE